MWNILFLQNTGKDFELVGSRCPLECAMLDHSVIAGNCSLFSLPIRNQTSSGTSWKLELIYISLHCYQCQAYNCFQADLTWATLSHMASPNPLWHVELLMELLPATNSLGTAGFQGDTPQNVPFPTPWMRHLKTSPWMAKPWDAGLKSAWKCSRPGWIKPEQPGWVWDVPVASRKLGLDDL